MPAHRELSDAREEGRIGFNEFATDPCRSRFARFFTRLDDALTANASINVVPMNGGYVALTEIPLAVQFDPGTLETLGVTGYDDQLDGRSPPRIRTSCPAPEI